MISSSEIKRIAGINGIDPMIIERDYIIGCYLHHIANKQVLQEDWIFKGGTCLKKCYFYDYRFSEDLDFTIQTNQKVKDIKTILGDINQSIQNNLGIRFDFQDIVVDVIQDDYGRESFEVKNYYRGPLEYRGSPPALKLHLNRDEIICFPPKKMKIDHNYSDKGDLPESSILSYSLEEALIEKCRAVAGQRKFAIARDLYDIYKLTQQKIDIKKSFNAFEKKCRIKGISKRNLDLNQIIQKKNVYFINWQQNLEYLIPEDQKISFESAWECTIGLLKKIFI